MTHDELWKLTQLLDDRDKRLDQKLDEKLKGLATKSDLDEIKQTMATKSDLAVVKNDLEEIKKDVEEVKQTMATKKDLESMERRMNKKFREVRTDIAIYAGQTETRMQRIETHVGLPSLH